MITWYHFKDSREVGHYLNRWWQFRVSEKTTYSTLTSVILGYNITIVWLLFCPVLSFKRSLCWADGWHETTCIMYSNTCSDGQSIKRSQSITFPLNIFELLLPRNCLKKSIYLFIFKKYSYRILNTCYITSCMRMACWMSLVWKHSDRWRCWTAVERKPIRRDRWQLFLHYLSAGSFRAQQHF